MKFLRLLLAVALSSLLAVAGVDARPRAVTSSNGFNGGKSQIGVNFLQIADDYAFMNGMKGAQQWSYGDGSGIPDPTELDTNGYPIPGANAFSHSGVRTVFFMPLQSERPGNYAITWDGISNLSLPMVNTVLPTATFTGSVTGGVLTAGAPSGGTIQKGMKLSTGGIIGDQITGSAGQAGTYNGISLTTAGSQSMSVSGGSTTGASATGNRYVFSTTDFAFNVGFASVTQTPSNLKVFHVDDEVELNAGEILGKKYRQNWAYMKAGVIRFGDWMPMNTTNVTTWATRKPVNYVFYAGQEYRASLWAGNASNGGSGNAYTTSLTPSGWTGLVDKATVQVNFVQSATSDTATLNVAGTGAIIIRDWYGDPTSVGGNTRPFAGRMGTLVYDAALNAWLKSGGDVASGNAGLENGVAPEAMVAIATKLGAHPYFTTPYLAADPITDYMPSLAAYVRDNGPSWMIPRFETTNETWNFGFGFFGTRYAWNKALVYWPAQGNFNTTDWIGKSASLLGQAISGVYSNNRTRYHVIAGLRTTDACGDAACTINNTAASNARINSTTWITNGPSQAGYSNAAGVGEAYRWVTHVAMANYLNPDEQYTLQELRDAYAYVVTNAGNSAAQTTLANTYVDTMPSSLAMALSIAQKWQGWAQGNWGGSFNLQLVAYEGGYSPDYSQTVWTSPITGASVTSGTTVNLTLATTENNHFNTGNGNALSGNPAVIGMQLAISGVGGMTQLNGNTYPVAGVSGNTITITIPNTAGFGAYTSGGTSSYVNSELYTNTLRYAGKFAPRLQNQMTQHYADMASVPMLFPSNFNFAGPSIAAAARGGGFIGQSGQVWGLYDPSVYALPYSTAVESIRLFNQ